MKKLNRAFADIVLGILFVVGILGLAYLVGSLAQVAPGWANVVSVCIVLAGTVASIIVAGRTIREHLTGGPL